MTGGNFRLLTRFLTQIERFLSVNDLHLVSTAVVEAAQDCLVVGPGWRLLRQIADQSYLSLSVGISVSVQGFSSATQRMNRRDDPAIVQSVSPEFGSGRVKQELKRRRSRSLNLHCISPTSRSGLSCRSLDGWIQGVLNSHSEIGLVDHYRDVEHLSGFCF
jgi:hypothetical protein